MGQRDVIVPLYHSNVGIPPSLGVVVYHGNPMSGIPSMLKNHPLWTKQVMPPVVFDIYHWDYNPFETKKTK